MKATWMRTTPLRLPAMMTAASRFIHGDDGPSRVPVIGSIGGDG